MKIVISSGHGKYVRGCSGYIDEVDEARRVVNEVGIRLNDIGIKTEIFHDDISKTQKENLHRIVSFHNSEDRQLDVSVHFNSYEYTGAPMGTETLYLTADALAQKVSTNISLFSGLKNRGPKKRTDLYFLNQTEQPAIIIEVCFVDSKADTEIYRAHFDQICGAITESLAADKPPPEETGFHAIGKASSFGGPEDAGVSPDEGLAFIFKVEDAPQLFLPIQPVGTTGLARRLNPYVHYLACRWDYTKTTKVNLLRHTALVRAQKTRIALKAFPADWGPNQATDRVADLSPSLMDDLGIQTDDTVEITFPYPP